jgi:hypothetical protein
MVEYIAEAGDCGGREGTELAKISAILNTAFMVIAVVGKISLEVLSGCDCRGLFKNASIFNCFPASDLRFNSTCADAPRLGQISPSSLAFLPSHPHNTLLPLPPSLMIDWETIHNFKECY